MLDVLAELEAMAWAIYLDKRTPRTFEVWLALWKKRKVDVPAGAWECP